MQYYVIFSIFLTLLYTSQSWAEVSRVGKTPFQSMQSRLTSGKKSKRQEPSTLPSQKSGNPEMDGLDPLEAMLAFKAHMHHNVQDIGKPLVHKAMKKNNLSSASDLLSESLASSKLQDHQNMDPVNSPTTLRPLQPLNQPPAMELPEKNTFPSSLSTPDVENHLKNDSNMLFNPPPVSNVDILPPELKQTPYRPDVSAIPHLPTLSNLTNDKKPSDTTFASAVEPLLRDIQKLLSSIQHVVSSLGGETTNSKKKRQVRHSVRIKGKKRGRKSRQVSDVDRILGISLGNDSKTLGNRLTLDQRSVDRDKNVLELIGDSLGFGAQENPAVLNSIDTLGGYVPSNSCQTASEGVLPAAVVSIECPGHLANVSGSKEDKLKINLLTIPESLNALKSQSAVSPKEIESGTKILPLSLEPITESTHSRVKEKFPESSKDLLVKLLAPGVVQKIVDDGIIVKVPEKSSANSQQGAKKSHTKVPTNKKKKLDPIDDREDTQLTIRLHLPGYSGRKLVKRRDPEASDHSSLKTHGLTKGKRSKASAQRHKSSKSTIKHRQTNKLHVKKHKKSLKKKSTSKIGRKLMALAPENPFLLPDYFEEDNLTPEKPKMAEKKFNNVLNEIQDTVADDFVTPATINRMRLAPRLRRTVNVVNDEDWVETATEPLVTIRRSAEQSDLSPDNTTVTENDDLSPGDDTADDLSSNDDAIDDDLTPDDDTVVDDDDLVPDTDLAGYDDVEETLPGSETTISTPKSVNTTKITKKPSTASLKRSSGATPSPGTDKISSPGPLGSSLAPTLSGKPENTTVPGGTTPVSTSTGSLLLSETSRASSLAGMQPSEALETSKVTVLPPGSSVTTIIPGRITGDSVTSSQSSETQPVTAENVSSVVLETNATSTRAEGLLTSSAEPSTSSNASSLASEPLETGGTTSAGGLNVNTTVFSPETSSIGEVTVYSSIGTTEKQSTMPIQTSVTPGATEFTPTTGKTSFSSVVTTKVSEMTSTGGISSTVGLETTSRVLGAESSLTTAEIPSTSSAEAANFSATSEKLETTQIPTEAQATGTLESSTVSFMSGIVSTITGIFSSSSVQPSNGPSSSGTNESGEISTEKLFTTSTPAEILSSSLNATLASAGSSGATETAGISEGKTSTVVFETSTTAGLPELGGVETTEAKIPSISSEVFVNLSTATTEANLPEIGSETTGIFSTSTEIFSNLSTTLIASELTSQKPSIGPSTSSATPGGFTTVLSTKTSPTTVEIYSTGSNESSPAASSSQMTSTVTLRLTTTLGPPGSESTFSAPSNGSSAETTTSSAGVTGETAIGGSSAVASEASVMPTVQQFSTTEGISSPGVSETSTPAISTEFPTPTQETTSVSPGVPETTTISTELSPNITLQLSTTSSATESPSTAGEITSTFSPTLNYTLTSTAILETSEITGRLTPAPIVETSTAPVATEVSTQAANISSPTSEASSLASSTLFSVETAVTSPKTVSTEVVEVTTGFKSTIFPSTSPEISVTPSAEILSTTGTSEKPEATEFSSETSPSNTSETSASPSPTVISSTRGETPEITPQATPTVSIEAATTVLSAELSSTTVGNYSTGLNESSIVSALFETFFSSPATPVTMTPTEISSKMPSPTAIATESPSAPVEVSSTPSAEASPTLVFTTTAGITVVSSEAQSSTAAENILTQSPSTLERTSSTSVAGSSSTSKSSELPGTSEVTSEISSTGAFETSTLFIASESPTTMPQIASGTSSKPSYAPTTPEGSLSVELTSGTPSVIALTTFPVLNSTEVPLTTEKIISSTTEGPSVALETSLEPVTTSAGAESPSTSTEVPLTTSPSVSHGPATSVMPEITKNVSAEASQGLLETSTVFSSTQSPSTASQATSPTVSETSSAALLSELPVTTTETASTIVSSPTTLKIEEKTNQTSIKVDLQTATSEKMQTPASETFTPTILSTVMTTISSLLTGLTSSNDSTSESTPVATSEPLSTATTASTSMEIPKITDTPSIMTDANATIPSTEALSTSSSAESTSETGEKSSTPVQTTPVAATEAGLPEIGSGTTGIFSASSEILSNLSTTLIAGELTSQKPSTGPSTTPSLVISTVSIPTPQEHIPTPFVTSSPSLLSSTKLETTVVVPQGTSTVIVEGSTTILSTELSPTTGEIYSTGLNESSIASASSQALLSSLTTPVTVKTSVVTSEMPTPTSISAEFPSAPVEVSSTPSAEASPTLAFTTTAGKTVFSSEKQSSPSAENITTPYLTQSPSALGTTASTNLSTSVPTPVATSELPSAATSVSTLPEIPEITETPSALTTEIFSNLSTTLMAGELTSQKPSTGPSTSSVTPEGSTTVLSAETSPTTVEIFSTGFNESSPAATLSGTVKTTASSSEMPSTVTPRLTTTPGPPEIASTSSAPSNGSSVETTTSSAAVTGETVTGGSSAVASEASVMPTFQQFPSTAGISSPGVSETSTPAISTEFPTPTQETTSVSPGVPETTTISTELSPNVTLQLSTTSSATESPSTAGEITSTSSPTLNYTSTSTAIPETSEITGGLTSAPIVVTSTAPVASEVSTQAANISSPMSEASSLASSTLFSVETAVTSPKTVSTKVVEGTTGIKEVTTGIKSTEFPSTSPEISTTHSPEILSTTGTSKKLEMTEFPTETSPSNTSETSAGPPTAGVSSTRAETPEIIPQATSTLSIETSKTILSTELSPTTVGSYSTVSNNSSIPTTSSEIAETTAVSEIASPGVFTSIGSPEITSATTGMFLSSSETVFPAFTTSIAPVITEKMMKRPSTQPPEALATPSPSIPVETVEISTQPTSTGALETSTTIGLPEMIPETTEIVTTSSKAPGSTEISSGTSSVEAEISSTTWKNETTSSGSLFPSSEAFFPSTPTPSSPVSVEITSGEPSTSKSEAFATNISSEITSASRETQSITTGSPSTSSTTPVAGTTAEVSGTYVGVSTTTAGETVFSTQEQTTLSTKANATQFPVTTASEASVEPSYAPTTPGESQSVGLTSATASIIALTTFPVVNLTEISSTTEKIISSTTEGPSVALETSLGPVSTSAGAESPSTSTEVPLTTSPSVFHGPSTSVTPEITKNVSAETSQGPLETSTDFSSTQSPSTASQATSPTVSETSSAVLPSELPVTTTETASTVVSSPTTLKIEEKTNQTSIKVDLQTATSEKMHTPASETFTPTILSTVMTTISSLLTGLTSSNDSTSESTPVATSQPLSTPEETTSTSSGTSFTSVTPSTKLATTEVVPRETSAVVVQGSTTVLSTKLSPTTGEIYSTGLNESSIASASSQALLSSLTTPVTVTTSVITSEMPTPTSISAESPSAPVEVSSTPLAEASSTLAFTTTAGGTVFSSETQSSPAAKNITTPYLTQSSSTLGMTSSTNFSTSVFMPVTTSELPSAATSASALPEIPKITETPSALTGIPSFPSAAPAVNATISSTPLGASFTATTEADLPEIGSETTGMSSPSSEIFSNLSTTIMAGELTSQKPSTGPSTSATPSPSNMPSTMLETTEVVPQETSTVFAERSTTVLSAETSPTTVEIYSTGSNESFSAATLSGAGETTASSSEMSSTVTPRLTTTPGPPEIESTSSVPSNGSSVETTTSSAAVTGETATGGSSAVASEASVIPTFQQFSTTEGISSPGVSETSTPAISTEFPTPTQETTSVSPGISETTTISTKLSPNVTLQLSPTSSATESPSTAGEITSTSSPTLNYTSTSTAIPETSEITGGLTPAPIVETSTAPVATEVSTQAANISSPTSEASSLVSTTPFSVETAVTSPKTVSTEVVEVTTGFKSTIFPSTSPEISVTPSAEILSTTGTSEKPEATEFSSETSPSNTSETSASLSPTVISSTRGETPEIIPQMTSTVSIGAATTVLSTELSSTTSESSATSLEGPKNLSTTLIVTEFSPTTEEIISTESARPSSAFLSTKITETAGFTNLTQSTTQFESSTPPSSSGPTPGGFPSTTESFSTSTLAGETQTLALTTEIQSTVTQPIPIFPEISSTTTITSSKMSTNFSVASTTSISPNISELSTGEKFTTSAGASTPISPTELTSTAEKNYSTSATESTSSQTSSESPKTTEISSEVPTTMTSRVETASESPLTTAEVSSGASTGLISIFSSSEAPETTAREKISSVQSSEMSTPSISPGSSPETEATSSVSSQMSETAATSTKIPTNATLEASTTSMGSESPPTTEKIASTTTTGGPDIFSLEPTAQFSVETTEIPTEKPSTEVSEVTTEFKPTEFASTTSETLITSPTEIFSSLKTSEKIETTQISSEIPSPATSEAISVFNRTEFTSTTNEISSTTSGEFSEALSSSRPIENSTVVAETSSTEPSGTSELFTTEKTYFPSPVAPKSSKFGGDTNRTYPTVSSGTTWTFIAPKTVAQTGKISVSTTLETFPSYNVTEPPIFASTTEEILSVASTGSSYAPTSSTEPEIGGSTAESSSKMTSGGSTMSNQTESWSTSEKTSSTTVLTTQYPPTMSTTSETEGITAENISTTSLSSFMTTNVTESSLTTEEKFFSSSSSGVTSEITGENLSTTSLDTFTVSNATGSRLTTEKMAVTTVFLASSSETSFPSVETSESVSTSSLEASSMGNFTESLLTTKEMPSTMYSTTSSSILPAGSEETSEMTSLRPSTSSLEISPVSNMTELPTTSEEMLSRTFTTALPTSTSSISIGISSSSNLETSSVQNLTEYPSSTEETSSTTPGELFNGSSTVVLTRSTELINETATSVMETSTEINLTKLTSTTEEGTSPTALESSDVFSSSTEVKMKETVTSGVDNETESSVRPEIPQFSTSIGVFPGSTALNVSETVGEIFSTSPQTFTTSSGPGSTNISEIEVSSGSPEFSTASVAPQFSSTTEETASKIFTESQNASESTISLGLSSTMTEMSSTTTSETLTSLNVTESSFLTTEKISTASSLASSPETTPETASVSETSSAEPSVASTTGETISAGFNASTTAIKLETIPETLSTLISTTLGMLNLTESTSTPEATLSSAEISPFTPVMSSEMVETTKESSSTSSPVIFTPSNASESSEITTETGSSAFNLTESTATSEKMFSTSMEVVSSSTSSSETSPAVSSVISSAVTSRFTSEIASTSTVASSVVSGLTESTSTVGETMSEGPKTTNLTELLTSTEEITSTRVVEGSASSSIGEISSTSTLTPSTTINRTESSVMTEEIGSTSSEIIKTSGEMFSTVSTESSTAFTPSSEQETSEIVNQTSLELSSTPENVSFTQSTGLSSPLSSLESLGSSEITSTSTTEVFATFNATKVGFMGENTTLATSTSSSTIETTVETSSMSSLSTFTRVNGTVAPSTTGEMPSTTPVGSSVAVLTSTMSETWSTTLSEASEAFNLTELPKTTEKTTSASTISTFPLSSSLETLETSLSTEETVSKGFSTASETPEISTTSKISFTSTLEPSTLGNVTEFPPTTEEISSRIFFETSTTSPSTFPTSATSTMMESMSEVSLPSVLEKSGEGNLTKFETTTEEGSSVTTEGVFNASAPFTSSESGYVTSETPSTSNLTSFGSVLTSEITTATPRSSTSGEMGGSTSGISFTSSLTTFTTGITSEFGSTTVETSSTPSPEVFLMSIVPTSRETVEEMTESASTANFTTFSSVVMSESTLTTREIEETSSGSGSTASFMAENASTTIESSSATSTEAYMPSTTREIAETTLEIPSTSNFTTFSTVITPESASTTMEMTFSSSAETSTASTTSTTREGAEKTSEILSTTTLPTSTPFMASESTSTTVGITSTTSREGFATSTSSTTQEISETTGQFSSTANLPILLLVTTPESAATTMEIASTTSAEASTMFTPSTTREITETTSQISSTANLTTFPSVISSESAPTTAENTSTTSLELSTTPTPSTTPKFPENTTEIPTKLNLTTSTTSNLTESSTPTEGTSFYPDDIIVGAPHEPPSKFPSQTPNISEASTEVSTARTQETSILVEMHIHVQPNASNTSLTSDKNASQYPGQFSTETIRGTSVLAEVNVNLQPESTLVPPFPQVSSGIPVNSSTIFEIPIFYSPSTSRIHLPFDENNLLSPVTDDYDMVSTEEVPAVDSYVNFDNLEATQSIFGGSYEPTTEMFIPQDNPVTLDPNFSVEGEKFTYLPPGTVIPAGSRATGGVEGMKTSMNPLLPGSSMAATTFRVTTVPGTTVGSSGSGQTGQNVPLSSSAVLPTTSSLSGALVSSSGFSEGAKPATTSFPTTVGSGEASVGPSGPQSGVSGSPEGEKPPTTIFPATLGSGEGEKLATTISPATFGSGEASLGPSASLTGVSGSPESEKPPTTIFPATVGSGEASLGLSGPQTSSSSSQIGSGALKELGNYIFDDDEDVWREKPFSRFNKDIDKSKMEYEKDCARKNKSRNVENPENEADDYYNGGRKLMHIKNDDSTTKNKQKTRSLATQGLPRIKMKIHEGYYKLPKFWKSSKTLKRPLERIQDETFMRNQFKVDDYDQRIHPTMVQRLSEHEWTEQSPQTSRKSDFRWKRDVDYEDDDDYDDYDEISNYNDVDYEEQYGNEYLNLPKTKNNQVSSVSQREMIKKDLISYLQSIKNEMKMLKSENGDFNSKKNLLTQIKRTLKNSETELKKVESSIENVTDRDRSLPIFNNGKIGNSTPDVRSSLGLPEVAFPPGKSAIQVTDFPLSYDKELKNGDFEDSPGLRALKDVESTTENFRQFGKGNLNPLRRVFKLNYDPEVESHVVLDESSRGGSENGATVRKIAGKPSGKLCPCDKTTTDSSWPTERVTNFHIGGTRTWFKELQGLPPNYASKNPKKCENTLGNDVQPSVVIKNTSGVNIKPIFRTIKSVLDSKSMKKKKEMSNFYKNHRKFKFLGKNQHFMKKKHKNTHSGPVHLRSLKKKEENLEKKSKFESGKLKQEKKRSLNVKSKPTKQLIDQVMKMIHSEQEEITHLAPGVVYTPQKPVNFLENVKMAFHRLPGHKNITSKRPEHRERPFLRPGRRILRKTDNNRGSSRKIGRKSLHKTKKHRFNSPSMLGGPFGKGKPRKTHFPRGKKIPTTFGHGFKKRGETTPGKSNKINITSVVPAVKTLVESRHTGNLEKIVIFVEKNRTRPATVKKKIRKDVKRLKKSFFNTENIQQPENMEFTIDLGHLDNFTDLKRAILDEEMKNDKNRWKSHDEKSALTGKLNKFDEKSTRKNYQGETPKKIVGKSAENSWETAVENSLTTNLDGNNYFRDTLGETIRILYDMRHHNDNNNLRKKKRVGRAVKMKKTISHLTNDAKNTKKKFFNPKKRTLSSIKKKSGNFPEKLVKFGKLMANTKKKHVTKPEKHLKPGKTGGKKKIHKKKKIKKCQRIIAGIMREKWCRRKLKTAINLPKYPRLMKKSFGSAKKNFPLGINRFRSRKVHSFDDSEEYSENDRDFRENLNDFHDVYPPENISNQSANSENFFRDEKATGKIFKRENFQSDLKTAINQSLSGCDDCICDLENAIKGITSLLTTRRHLLSRISSFSCQKFVPIGREIELTSSRILGDILPRSRRDLADARGLKYIRPDELENTLRGGRFLRQNHEILSFPGADLNIPCSRNRKLSSWMSFSRPKYSWKRADGSLVSGKIKANGDLELSGLDSKDAGNYSCTVTYLDPDNEELIHQTFPHLIQIVTLPRYSLRGGNRYRLDQCEESDLEALAAYFPAKLNEILCNHGLVCDAFIFAPRCLDDEMAIRSLVVPTRFSRIFSAATARCGLRCRRAIQDKITWLLSRNLRAILRKPIVFSFADSRRETLLPYQSRPGREINNGGEFAGEVGLFVGCPAGYGLENSHCAPCSPGFHSPDMASHCQRCPLGFHQPNSGARLCNACVNPFIEGCYNMLWTSSSVFLLILTCVVAAVVITCIIVMAVCYAKRNKFADKAEQPLLTSKDISSDDEFSPPPAPRKTDRIRTTKQHSTHKAESQPLVYGIDLVQSPKCPGTSKASNPVRKVETICLYPNESYRSHGEHCPQCKYSDHCRRKNCPRPPQPCPDFDR